MNNSTEEFSDNPFLLMNEGLNKLRRFSRKINTPTNPNDYIFVYGILFFDSKNGLFKYGDKKPIQMFGNKIPYKIMKLLFFNPGFEVDYKTISEKINIKFLTKKEQRIAKEKIRQTFKNIRRELEINSRKNPEENPFLMTGNGVKLAFINK